jgi:hypothetical protein
MAGGDLIGLGEAREGGPDGELAWIPQAENVSVDLDLDVDVNIDGHVDLNVVSIFDEQSPRASKVDSEVQVHVAVKVAVHVQLDVQVHVWSASVGTERGHISHAFM